MARSFDEIWKEYSTVLVRLDDGETMRFPIELIEAMESKEAVVVVRSKDDQFQLLWKPSDSSSKFRSLRSEPFSRDGMTRVLRKLFSPNVEDHFLTSGTKTTFQVLFS